MNSWWALCLYLLGRKWLWVFSKALLFSPSIVAYFRRFCSINHTCQTSPLHTKYKLYTENGMFCVMTLSSSKEKWLNLWSTFSDTIFVVVVRNQSLFRLVKYCPNTMWINIYPKLERVNRINYLTRTVTSQQTQCKLCEL